MMLLAVGGKVWYARLECRGAGSEGGQTASLALLYQTDTSTTYLQHNSDF